MNIIDLINKKNNKGILTKREIEFFVKGFSCDEISKEDATKFLTAIYNNGLNLTETTNLTLSMARSGDIIDLTDVGDCVDKHSTGGVSDTTTLVIVPLLASLGVKVAKMSGRSLGWTGGTADKVEVFDGYNNDLSVEEFKNNINKIGACLISQSDKLAVADKKIYKLRDETGLVDNISLIASSIMSKKIACGAKILLLDVKYGNGAFMQKFQDAKKLAKTMVKIGNKAGIKTSAVISNMNEPLSNYIGNNLEVYSAIEVLNGKDNNLSKLSKIIVATILKNIGKVETIEEGINLASENLKNKKALKKFEQIIKYQGGNIYKLTNSEILLHSEKCVEIKATKTGYISKILCKKLGDCVHKVCYLEEDKNAKNMVGLKLLKSKNDYILKGETIAVLNYYKAKDLKKIIKEIKAAFVISKNKGKEFDLVKEIIF